MSAFTWIRLVSSPLLSIVLTYSILASTHKRWSRNREIQILALSRVRNGNCDLRFSLLQLVCSSPWTPTMWSLLLFWIRISFIFPINSRVIVLLKSSLNYASTVFHLANLVFSECCVIIVGILLGLVVCSVVFVWGPVILCRIQLTKKRRPKRVQDAREKQELIEETK